MQSHDFGQHRNFCVHQRASVHSPPAASSASSTTPVCMPHELMCPRCAVCLRAYAICVLLTIFPADRHDETCPQVLPAVRVVTNQFMAHFKCPHASRLRVKTLAKQDDLNSSTTSKHRHTPLKTPTTHRAQEHAIDKERGPALSGAARHRISRRRTALTTPWPGLPRQLAARESESWRQTAVYTAAGTGDAAVQCTVATATAV